MIMNRKAIVEFYLFLILTINIITKISFNETAVIISGDEYCCKEI